MTAIRNGFELMVTTILKYAIPVIFSRLAGVLLEIGAVIIVGHLGITVLSAYGLASPLYLTIYLIAIAYLLVFSVRAAKLKENKELLSNYVSASLVFGLGLSAALIIILNIIPSILPLLGQAPNISKMAGHFFYIIALGMPPLMCSVILNQLFIVLRRPIFVATISFLQLIFGIFLVYVFAYHYGLGIRGVALGFVITFWIKCFIFIGYLLLFCRTEFQFKITTRVALLKDTSFLLHLGWPVSLQYSGELLAGSIATLMIGHLYVNALAAQQIATQLRVFLIMLAFGLSQACVILIASAFKNSTVDRHYVNLVLKTALKIGFAIILFLLLLVNIFSLEYIRLFIHTNSPDVISLAKIFLLITSVALIFDTIKYLIMGVLRALKNTRTPMVYSLFIYWFVGIPLAYFLGYHTNLGAIGVRLGMLLGLIASVVVLSVYYRHFCRTISE